MGREKKKRQYQFKPYYKEFISKLVSNGNIKLNSDEIEAIYLMDYKVMYQEDAASLMGISRPTLSRILKNARHKIASALVCGLDINIEDKKENYIIACCVDDEKYVTSILPKEKYIAIISIEIDKIKNIKYIENPSHNLQTRPGEVLPDILEKENANYFITSKIGTGLKAAVFSKGIHVIMIDQFKNFEQIVEDILKL